MCGPHSLLIGIVEIAVTQNSLIIEWYMGVGKFTWWTEATDSNSLTLLCVKHFQSGWKHQIHETSELNKGATTCE
jgi:hypothetical protein